MARLCLQLTLLLAMGVPACAQDSELERLAATQGRLRSETAEIERRLEVFVEGLQRAEPEIAASLRETWDLLRESLITKRMQRIEALLQAGQAFEAKHTVAEVITGLQALLDFLCSIEQGLSETALDDARLQILESLCEELLQRQRALTVRSRRATPERVPELVAEQQRLAEEARRVGRKPSLQARLRRLADQLRAAGRRMQEAAGELAAQRFESARSMQKSALEQLNALQDGLHNQRAAWYHARRFEQLHDLQAQVATGAQRLRGVRQKVATEAATFASRGVDYRRHFGLKTALLAEELTAELERLRDVQRIFERRGALVYVWMLERMAGEAIGAAELLTAETFEDRCTDACLESLERAVGFLECLAGALSVEQRRLELPSEQS